LLIPLGTREDQVLVSFQRNGTDVVRRDIGPVRFVPLLGTHGWQG
jgi:protein-L-isoaspartate(D-aspartate) O-methyltransferase